MPCDVHSAALTTDLICRDLVTILTIYNAACVQWAVNLTSKGLRHIQIRENAVRESVQNGFASIKHIQGSLNLSDMFTKEDKDVGHFLTIRNIVMSPSPKHSSG